MSLVVSDPDRTVLATDRQLETLNSCLMNMDIEEADIPEYLMDNYGVELPLTKKIASEVLDLVLQDVKDYWDAQRDFGSEMEGYKYDIF